jgi:hypothetical protein
MDSNSIVFLFIAPRNAESVISTAVIDYYVFPIAVGLSQHALNTLRQVIFSVVNGGNYTDQRLGGCIHVDFKSAGC